MGVLRMTKEHFKYCGTPALHCLLQFLNMVILNIYYMSCKPIKVGLASAIHKGKGRPLTLTKSFRRITVNPHIGSLIDEYLSDPTEYIFRPLQSTTQYGFTADMSYLLGAVLRNECESWAVDQKQTLFEVTIDGDSAFDVTDREICVRELFENGEEGDIWQYSRGLYQNTECTIKMNDEISRTFQEQLGSRQGHKKSSGHYDNSHG